MFGALVVNLAACNASAPAPDGPRFQGKVIAVADGDTVTVLKQNEQEVKVRLADIDAPERGQPWSRQSEPALTELVGGRTVTVRQTDSDQYGRVVGRVEVTGRDVNREMVKTGAAWAFRRYLTDPSLIQIEASAKQARRGLWSQPADATTAPWDWRAGVRASAAAHLPAASEDPTTGPRPLLAAPATESAFRCGERRYCKEMRSCAEARFHLRQCGLSRLDRDGDGRPCEAICSSAPR